MCWDLDVAAGWSRACCTCEEKQTIVVTAANDAHVRKWNATELDCLDARQHMAGTLNQGPSVLMVR